MISVGYNTYVYIMYVTIVCSKINKKKVTVIRGKMMMRRYVCIAMQRIMWITCII